MKLQPIRLLISLTPHLTPGLGNLTPQKILIILLASIFISAIIFCAVTLRNLGGRTRLERKIVTSSSDIDTTTVGSLYSSADIEESKDYPDDPKFRGSQESGNNANMNERELNEDSLDYPDDPKFRGNWEESRTG